jgi:Lanthionine synthetase C-like protein
VYRHGLLRKGVGICHGVAGSVYALLAVSDILDHHSTNPAKPDQTPSKKYLLRAVHLAHLATSHETLTANGEMATPDRPWSLYEGTAGMCCAWAEVLLRLEGKRSLYRGMPGFDDLHETLVL